ncbi:MAG: hypothetical protein OIF32_05535 [Campylobacterales bacterium]|nr:hypothetical protein [Campylobacterales bacterium]
MEKIDILLVSNYSDSLNDFHKKISSHFSKEINYKILTYRKADVTNSFSYEEFLENEIEKIEAFDIEALNKKYTKTNLFLAVVCERLFVNYYSGTDKVLGNYTFNSDEINFLIKSFVLFLEPYIEKSSIVFSGYADNFISTLTFKISEELDKRCISFHPHWIISNNLLYLNDGIFCKPCKDVILTKEMPEHYGKHLEHYDVHQYHKEKIKNTLNVKKSLFGVFSPNFELLFKQKKHSPKNKKYRKYLEIDKIVKRKKIIANFYRLYVKLYLSFTMNWSKKIPDDKFIFFPLQLQPEASTGTVTPMFMNQISVIENISKSIPLGYILVVKEHPLGVGLRDITFYKQVSKIPNVMLLDVNVSGKEIIQKADFTIGYGGTILFESIVLGKKYFLLADDYIYTDSQLLHILRNIRDLHLEIKEFILKKVDNSDNERLRMQKYFYQRGFERFNEQEASIAKLLSGLL